MYKQNSAEQKYWLLTGFIRKSETGEISEICDSADSTQIIPTHTQDNLGAVSEANVRTQLCRPKHSGGRYLCNSFAKKNYVWLR